MPRIDHRDFAWLSLVVVMGLVTGCSTLQVYAPRDGPSDSQGSGAEERRLTTGSVGHFPMPDQVARYDLVVISSEYSAVWDSASSQSCLPRTQKCPCWLMRARSTIHRD